VNIFPISVPPLRERSEDIALLARYFTSKYARRMNKQIERIAIDTLEGLRRYSWPGNVRELQNYIERAVILATGTELRTPAPDLKPNVPFPSTVIGAHRSTLLDVERHNILEALRHSNWVIGGPAGAAARLGMKRTSLLYRMEKLGISRDFQAAD
jgi:formate hydrogenlyase transcriptional activator